MLGLVFGPPGPQYPSLIQPGKHQSLLGRGGFLASQSKTSDLLVGNPCDLNNSSSPQVFPALYYLEHQGRDPGRSQHHRRKDERHLCERVGSHPPAHLSQLHGGAH